MGVTLTTQQKEIYKQVQEPLQRAGAKISKSLVKQFVRWLSVSFLEVTEQDVKDRQFWKRVGAVLSERTKAGDPSVKESFIRIFLLVYDIVKESADTQDAQGTEKGPIASPVTSCIPCFEKTNRADVVPVFNPSPYHDFVPTAQNPCFSPFAPAVQPPQDGGGHATVPSSSQNSLLPVPAQNTPPALVFLPLPIPNLNPSSLAVVHPTAPPLAVAPPPLAPAPLHTALLAAATPTQGTPPLPGSHSNGRGGAVSSGKQKLVRNADPLFMVIYNARGQNPRWEPLSYESIRELCKAKHEFGERSEFFKSILKATLGSKTLVPAELRHLFNCLLSQSEFKMWERTWKRLAGDQLPEILQSPTYSTDIEDEEITLEHLVGEGDWSQAEKQAAGIPRAVLDLSRDAAERAFFNMPSKEPVVSYIVLKQSVTEPFMDFVDRVRASVEKRVQNPEIQDQLTLEIVTTNANEACQRVILALPASPPPTLDQLIEECTRKATLMTEDLVIKPWEKVVAEAMATPKTRRVARPPAPKRRCYFCNQEGHLIGQCPLRGTVPSQGGQVGAGEISNQQKN
uniref:endogenous retrovirus group K member 5 Gag polyprotein-like n=1 Tax=Lonchura striata TaxID=40157 RepID=UPI000B4CE49F|nr:endogenous retrovirus group K member 5 Gag polyprotein-like [Lonchura striata domestica]